MTKQDQQGDIIVRTAITLIRSVIIELSRTYCQRYNDQTRSIQIKITNILQIE